MELSHRCGAGRLSEQVAMDGLGRKEEEGDDRSVPHISHVVAGAFEAIKKYIGLQVGLRV